MTDIAEIQSGELLSDEDRAQDVSAEVYDEEIVGAGRVTVGDRVSASFDEATGAVAFYSNNGTLHGNWVDELEVDRNDITSIEVADGTVFLPEDARGVVEDDEDWYYQFFGGLENLETFVASGFDTSYVRDMGYMFVYCRSLERLDLSRFDTSNVEQMYGMFQECYNLIEVDLSGFDTSKVEQMWQMFWDCHNLTELDLSSFSTPSLSGSIGHMFSNCHSLEKVDMSNFDTSNVEYMDCMFENCHSLREVDVSGFDTSKVTDMGCMFQNCHNLEALNVSNFDTSNAESLERIRYVEGAGYGRHVPELQQPSGFGRK